MERSSTNLPQKLETRDGADINLLHKIEKSKLDTNIADLFSLCNASTILLLFLLLNVLQLNFILIASYVTFPTQKEHRITG